MVDVSDGCTFLRFFLISMMIDNYCKIISEPSIIAGWTGGNRDRLSFTTANNLKKKLTSFSMEIVVEW